MPHIPFREVFMMNNKMRVFVGLSMAFAGIGCSNPESMSKLTGNGPGMSRLSAQSSTPEAGVVVNPANGHSYQLFVNDGRRPMSLADARAQAEAMGGSLATVTSQDEQDFINANIDSSGDLFVFLGASQPDGAEEPGGGWMWLNGEPWTYTNWGPGEPNNVTTYGNENILQMHNGVWNDNVDTLEDLGGISNAFLVEWEGGDTTPPVIVNAAATPGLLWPPNHKWVNVEITATVSDDQDPAPSFRIVSVTSNEPENGLGDGDVSPDWDVTGDHTLKLRAERSGLGNGRVYTVRIEARDAAGNTATADVLVKVPHSK
jgi:hypothetical protein